MVEDAPVAGCYGVVCFIDDNDGKLISMKPCEASAIAGQCRHRGNDDLRIGGGTRAGLFNLRFQFWVDGSKLVPRLQEQFFPMRQHQQAFLHLQNSWEMSEHYRFSGARGQRHYHPAFIRLVCVADCVQRLALIRTQKESFLLLMCLRSIIHLMQ